MSDADLQKESPPPQDLVPAPSPTPELDAEGKVKKSRNTIILREVDPAATEEQILGLFTNTDMSVTSARMDVQNTWFVTLETEEQAKQAIPHLSNQMLCGKPVKARIKSEGGLRTSAPTWQPPSQSQSAPPMYVHPTATYNAGSYTPQSSPPPGVVLYNNWGGKPASVVRPPGAGGFKKVNPSSVPVGSATTASESGTMPQTQQQPSNQQTQAQGGANQQQLGQGLRNAGQRGGGKSGQSRASGAGGERRSRKPQSSPTSSKPVAFQPQDFPSLSGQTASIEAAPASVPVSEAPANSWAALAKKSPEPTPAQVPQKKKVDVVSSKTEKHVASEKKEAVDDKVENAPTKSAEPAVSSTEMTATEIAAAEEQARADDIKKRGWEKPGLPKKAPTPPNSENAAEEQPTLEEKPQQAATTGSVKESSNKEGKEKRQSGRKGKDRETNGQPPLPPVQPPSWGTKSFADVIKEKPTGGAPAAPASLKPTSGTAVLSTLKASENWGDVEDDESAADSQAKSASRPVRSAPATQGTAAAGQTSSDNSADWRKDAAARRKSEEAFRSGRRPNGSPS